MKGVIITMMLFCLLGCADETGKFSGLLPREKMEVVMWEIIGADVFTEHFIKKDSLKNPSIENVQLQNKIFALHNVTKDNFYRSYEYYVSHTDLLQVLLDSMVSKAERDRAKMMERYRGRQPK